MRLRGCIVLLVSLIPRPSITANAVDDQVKLLRRLTSSGRLKKWTFEGVA